MSIDHDYAFANSSKKPSIISSDGRQTAIGQIVSNQDHRLFQKGPNGQQMTIHQSYQSTHLPDGRLVQRVPTMVNRVVHQPNQNVRGAQYVVVTTASNSQGMAGTIAGRAAAAATSVHHQQIRQIVPQPHSGQHVVVNQPYQRIVNPLQQTRVAGSPYMNTQNMYPQDHQQSRQVRYMTAPSTTSPSVAYRQIPQQQQQHIAQRYPHPQMRPSTGMNLAVPLREPSPEPPAPPVQAPPPQAEMQSTSNQEPMPDEDADIDIQIRNVVCNYTLPLHIDLRKLAMCTSNVTYEREKGVMMKQKRNPGCYIKVYSSGKVYIVGCRSEVDCKRAARSIARHIQKVMGKANERVSIRNYRVNNVLATCRMPFGIKIEDVAVKYPKETTYETELSVGLVWKSTTPKATLRIHTTGSITVTGASSEADVLTVISQIYPILLEFRCADRAKGNVQKRKRKAPISRAPVKRERYDISSYGSSGVVNNKVYFSDEDDDLYDDLDLDE